MAVEIFVEIVICAFALLGIYSMIDWIARRLFGSRRTVIAIEILTQRDVEAAEMLIRDALFSALGLPSGRIVVLTTREFWENEAFRTMLARYGVSSYWVEEAKK